VSTISINTSGGIRGGVRGVRPPKIEKNMIFWRKIVIFHTKYPKNTRVISNTGKFFCFNNNVSNLYNNSVVEQINGMAYIFTLLLFRKPNKTTINKNKTTNKYFRSGIIYVQN
jgi:hypothetical protein